MDQASLVQNIVIPTIQILVVVLVLPLAIAYLQLVERKVLGFMQVRLAPRRVGWHVEQQTIAGCLPATPRSRRSPAASGGAWRCAA